MISNDKKIFWALKKISEDISTCDIGCKEDLLLAIDTLAHVFEYCEDDPYYRLGDNEARLLKIAAKRLELVAEQLQYD